MDIDTGSFPSSCLGAVCFSGLCPILLRKVCSLHLDDMEHHNPINITTRHHTARLWQLFDVHGIYL